VGIVMINGFTKKKLVGERVLKKKVIYSPSIRFIGLNRCLQTLKEEKLPEDRIFQIARDIISAIG
jgi:hypothetical protein